MNFPKKNFAIIMLFIFISCSDDSVEQAEEPDLTSCDFTSYRYYYHEQQELGEMDEEFIVLGIRNEFTDEEIASFVSSFDVFDQTYEYSLRGDEYFPWNELPIKFSSPKTCEEITYLMSQLREYSIISYTHFAFQTDDCTGMDWEPLGERCILSYDNTFFVKVFDKDDLTDLNEMMEETKTVIFEQFSSLPEWFVLKTTEDSPRDALAMAVYFYESGLFDLTDFSFTHYGVE